MLKQIAFIWLALNYAPLFSQSVPEWGSWWQQPIPREYGGTARNAHQPLDAEEQIDQYGLSNNLQRRSEEQRYERQRALNEALQQKRVTEKLQQRITDELMQQGNVEEILRQKNIDDLVQQRRYGPLYEGPQTSNY